MQEFIEAVHENNLDKLIQLVESGFDINGTIPDVIYGAKTHLEYVAEYGTLDFLKCLVENDYDLLRENNEGYSLLKCFARQVMTGFPEKDELVKMTIFLMGFFDENTIIDTLSYIQSSSVFGRNGALEIFLQARAEIQDACLHLKTNSQMVGHWQKNRNGFFGWLPCEISESILVYSRNPECISSVVQAKKMVTDGMNDPHPGPRPNVK